MSVGVCIPGWLADRIDDFALRTGRSRSAALRDIIAAGFSQFEKIERPVQLAKYKRREPADITSPLFNLGLRR